MKIYVLLFKETDDKTVCVSEDIFKIQSEVQAHFRNEHTYALLTLETWENGEVDDRHIMEGSRIPCFIEKEIERVCRDRQKPACEETMQDFDNDYEMDHDFV